MDPRIYIFKIKYGDILRRISASAPFDFGYGLRGEGPDMTFSQLQSTIREAFQIPAASTVSIVYTDRDNDEVTMVDDSDIQDACVYQKLNPVRVTVLPHAPPSPSAFAVDPPPWAADILLKLDQILVAVNKPPLVEPGVIGAPASPVSTKTDDHVLEIGDSPLDGSTIQPAKDVFHSEQFDRAQTGLSEFLRRAAILRQREMTDDLQQSLSD